MIIVCASGGGLLAGTTMVSRAVRPDMRVIGVQSSASPSYGYADDTGQSVRFRQESTIADALTAPYFGQTHYEECTALGVDDVITVDDEHLIEALRFSHENEVGC